jgi:peroxisomal membrane protein 4
LQYRLPQKIQAIFRATLTHAINLTKFVTLYKLLLLLQRKVSREGKERSLDSFVAGALGGWWVFGERTAVSAECDADSEGALKIAFNLALPD